MSTELEIERIVRSHIDVRVVVDDDAKELARDLLEQLTQWIADECARRPILSDMFAVSVTHVGGHVSFNSLVDCAHGKVGRPFLERPSRTVVSVVVGSAAAILAQPGSTEISTAPAMLVWLIGDDATSALLKVHDRMGPRGRRTVADSSLTPELFLTTCQTVVRGVLERPGEWCGELVGSVGVSAAMRGVGYAVS